jgi:PadR family transcriptional regulator, regulatory protein PadR
MRKTHSLIKVMDALMQDPTAQHWGYELSRCTGVRSGVLYPILSRMLDEGWLEDGWEEQGIVSKKRPPRRYYKLTGEGQRSMEAVLAEAQRDLRFSTPLGQAS